MKTIIVGKVFSIIVGVAFVACAAGSPANSGRGGDYVTVTNILEQVGIPKEAIWEVAQFEGDKVVELDFSVKFEVVQDPTAYNVIEDTVYRFRPFRSLPSSIGDLARLKKLNLDGNDLTTLPDQIGKLTQLQVLSVRHNQLEKLPASMGDLANLRILDLKGNDLRSLPPSVRGWKSMVTLNLASNNLRDLGDEIGDLSTLKYLFLEGNPLRALPRSITSLKLRQFDVRYAGLRRIDRQTREWVRANNDEFSE